MASSSSSRQHFDLNSLSDPSGVFELIETVGSGTYGDVYKAKDVQSGRVAAVKIIKLEPGDNFSIIQQEILMMKNCHHPNIVAFYGSYLRRDKLWICMEYCGGGSLQDIYHVTGPLSEPQISLVCRETLKGLSYLHSLNMMHRDIKGANILLTSNGDVKLADFGVSAQITATMRKRKSFIGSPYWMAPEVAAVERKGGYNQQCDIWSVGITAIELYELQPPMFDMHPMKALNVMSRSNFKPPTLKDKNRCSEEYKNFVKSALIRSPKRRPSADRLLEHPFVNLEMPKQLMRDLLARATSANDFNHFPLETDIEEEKMLMDIPKKIPSVKPSSNDNIISAAVFEKERQVPEPSGLSVKLSESSNPTSSEAKLNDSCASQPQGDKPPEVPPRRKDRKRPLTTVGLPGSYQDDSTVCNNKPQRNSIQELPRTPGRFNLPPPPSLPPPPPPPSSYSTAKSTQADSNSRTLANGLPPTPRVLMGACFSKVFNGCPIRVNCAVSWIHPDTRNQHILFGCDEGIYTLNLNEIADACMDHIFPRRTTWMFVIKDVLMSISGKSVTHLYRHDLVNLHNSSNKAVPNRFGLQVDSMINKIPEKFVPRKFTASTKVSETKGCIACCVGKNPYNSYKYLCGAVQNGIFLMQWYNPMNKFMLLKQYQIYIPPKLTTFEMITTPDQEYPVLCVGVRANSDFSSLKLDLINLNSTSNMYGDEDFSSTIIPCQDQLNLVCVKQLDKHSILVCYDQTVHLVDLAGNTKPIGKTQKLKFDFDIKSLGKLLPEHSVMRIRLKLPYKYICTNQMSITPTNVLEQFVFLILSWPFTKMVCKGVIL